MIPQNQEHIEAHQETVNQQRGEFVSSLSKEDQAKFEAVEKALEILTAAGVQAFLFPLLPHPAMTRYSHNNAVYQYNNISSFFKWDKGKPPLQSVIDFHYFKSGLTSCFVGLMQGAFPSLSLVEIGRYICCDAYEWVEWARHGVEPKSIKDLRKEYGQQKD